MLKILTSFDGIVVFRYLRASVKWQQAETSAINGSWIDAHEHIKEALKYFGFKERPSRVPSPAVALAAIISYRLSRYDEVHNFILTAYSDGKRLYEKSTNEKYIRIFLKELMEYCSSSDADRSALYLDLARTIAIPYENIELPKVRKSLKQMFPLSGLVE